MREHEFFFLPDTSVILAKSPSFSATFCPLNDKIILVDGQVTDILKQLTYLKNGRSVETLSTDSVMVGVHATLTHESIHFMQKKDNYDGRFTGSDGNQHQEYHADFCAGYLNGRSVWLSRRGIAGLTCTKNPFEILEAVRSVLKPDNEKMEHYYSCLEIIMKEYQFVNGLSVVTRCDHGLEQERKKAYLNGFIGALNYGIKTWDPKNDTLLAAFLLQYGTIDEVKKKFADNLFGFLKTKFPVIDEQLWQETIMTDKYLLRGFTYTADLKFCKQ